MCQKSVLDPIPQTQHRPICMTVNPVIVPQPTTCRIQFNLKKPNWDRFSNEFDAAIEEVNLIPENYARFIELLRVVSRCRLNYIPGLTEESKSLYEAYKRQYSSNPYGAGTLEIGIQLIDTMKEQKRNKWEVITSTDLTHNSRKEDIQQPNLYNTSMSGQCKPICTLAVRQWPRNNVNKAKASCITNC